MCGICGYCTFSSVRPKWDEIIRLLMAAESRGKDATGIAYFTAENKLKISKAPIEASKFIKTGEFSSLEKSIPQVFIAHTRQKTQGDTKDHNNNHPIWTGEMALIHNGMIHNDKETFEKLKLKRVGEVDSEILARIIESCGYNYKEGLKLIAKECKGSASMAVLSSRHKQKLLLARSNNPLDLYFDVERDILFFASTDTILEKAIGHMEKIKWRGFEFEKKVENILTLKANTAVLIGEKGLEDTWDFDMETAYYNVTTHGGYDWQSDYDYKTGKWKDRKTRKEQIKDMKQKWDKMNNGTNKNGECDVCHRKGVLVKRAITFQYMDMCKICFMSESLKETTTLAGYSNTGWEKCNNCGGWTHATRLNNYGSELYCEKCFKWVSMNMCVECQEEAKDLIKIGEVMVCNKCAGLNGKNSIKQGG